MEDKISFSFGKNWESYNKTVSSQSILAAQENIWSWLSETDFKNKSVLDIGCGSGIHSRAFWQLGSSRIFSFDCDSASITATMQHWLQCEKPENWQVVQGSILDPISLQGEWDIVYSWGVLHHTGRMWKALENACRFVKKGGLLWIGLYTKGPRYEADLALKQRYNRASKIGQKVMIYSAILRKMRRRFLKGANPFRWNEKKSRGMNTFHDLVDWLGGLPYEVAAPDEVDNFLTSRGFNLKKSEIKKEGSVSVYLYQKV